MIKRIGYILCLVACLPSCKNTDDNTVEPPKKDIETGNIELQFSAILGPSPDSQNRNKDLSAQQTLELKKPGSHDFIYTMTLKDGQQQLFNISKFGFLLSTFVLRGENGLKYEVPMSVGPTKEDIKGLFLVDYSDPQSTRIVLEDIPKGTYNNIEFVVGIPKSIIKKDDLLEGFLDTEKGGWFWGWDNGYISMKIEGQAANSTQIETTHTPEKAFKYHIGGWGNNTTDPIDHETQSYNNSKTLSFSIYGGGPKIGGDNDKGLKYNPDIIVHVFVQTMLETANIDFGITNDINTPAKGVELANTFTTSFRIDHWHQFSGHTH